MHRLTLHWLRRPSEIYRYSSTVTTDFWVSRGERVQQPKVLTPTGFLASRAPPPLWNFFGSPTELDRKAYVGQTTKKKKPSSAAQVRGLLFPPQRNGDSILAMFSFIL